MASGAKQGSPQAPGWYKHEGRKHFWDGESWGAYWDAQEVAREREASPVTFSTILLYFASLVVPIVGLVASLVFLGQERARDALICLIAGLVGFAAIWLGLR